MMPNKISIKTDGKTVWVNNSTECLARLCTLSGEVYDRFICSTVPSESFDAWRERVKRAVGVEIPEEHRPPWAERVF